MPSLDLIVEPIKAVSIYFGAMGALNGNAEEVAWAGGAYCLATAVGLVLGGVKDYFKEEKLKELKEQIDSLKTKTERIGERVDQYHGLDEVVESEQK